VLFSALSLLSAFSFLLKMGLKPVQGVYIIIGQEYYITSLATIATVRTTKFPKFFM
jgi:hypothetical protein